MWHFLLLLLIVQNYFTFAAAENSTISISNIEYQIEILQTLNEDLSMRMEQLMECMALQTEALNNLTSKFDNQKDTDLHSSLLKQDQYEKCTSTFPASCAEAAAISRRSGIYTIQVKSFSNKPFLVSCDEESDDGGWTVIQRRINGSIDFQREWQDYKQGFGNLEGEFFIGLDKLHALTTDMAQELLIVMEDFEDERQIAKYDAFAIDGAQEGYALIVLGRYSGNAGDSLRYHVSFKFTTKDVDNDYDPRNCAQVFKGAWWYNKCHVSNLNGVYYGGDYSSDKFGQGIVWHTFHGYNYALKFVQMMIRPKRDLQQKFQW